MKVVIIYNDDERFLSPGSPPEILSQPGTVETAEAVEANLREKGVTPVLLPLVDDLGGFITALKDEDHDIIFNLCEGAFGLSTLEMNVAALLELLGVRFTGSGPITLGLCLNKAKAKEVLSANGIPTPRFFVVNSPLTTHHSPISFPLIVKPLMEDGSLGIDEKAVVKDMTTLRERVAYILKTYRQPALVEEYIEGREFNISILGNGRPRVLPISEIDFLQFPAGAPRICGYEAKWVPSSLFYIKTPPVCPAPISKALEEELSTVALRAYDALGCRDYARVDIRMGEDGICRVLEVNPNPDISPDAGLPRSARVAGMGYGELILEIIRVTKDRYAINSQRS
ncbi:MAG: ATP-grasp domain-containing protein [Deltaproteobacteria bacterium]|nr:ATP-grasp domain-containing protein [Deltaproteobacteria bacterium]